jgi:MFS superfamily sulfate permease-like transporter
MLTADRLAGGALAALALFVLWESRRLPLGSWRNPGPAAMPVALGLILLVLAVLLAALGGGSPRLLALGWGEAPHAVVIVAACAAAAWLLERLGYRLTMILLVAFLVGAIERRRLPVTALVTLGLALGSFYLFATLLRLPLPRGPFGI